MDLLAPFTSTLAVQHRNLLAAVEAIERIVAAPAPATFDLLAALRWSFTRDLLLHFAYVQTRVIEPLLSDVRTPVARYAARSSLDLVLVHEQFQRHAARWQGLPPAEHWADYRRAIDLLMRRTRVRLAAEESELYPSLPARPGGIRVTPERPPFDYAGDAWKIRRLIYAEQQRGAA